MHLAGAGCERLLQEMTHAGLIVHHQHGSQRPALCEVVVGQGSGEEGVHWKLRVGAPL